MIKTAGKAVLIGIFTMFATTGFADKAGLVGIQYGSEDFDDPENLVILDALENTWTEADGYGRQWAGSD